MNYQFNVLILPITLVPFSLIFVSLSIHYGKLLLETAGKSKNYKYFVIAFGVFIESVYISLILAANVRISDWHLEDRELNDTLRVVLASIYCFDVVMFCIRTAIFVRKLIQVSKSDSDNLKKKKKKYFVLCFWLILISFGYILTFVFLFASTFDRIKQDLTKNIIFSCFFYLGITICCFGLNFLFKPKKTKDKSSSTKSKSTNNN